MIPRVAGLPLDEAIRVLEAAGAGESCIERVSTPADFKRRKNDGARNKTEYVAAQWELDGGKIRLRVVSVPVEPIQRGC